MESPFPFQGPLEPDEVAGRDALVAELVERVSTRRVTALLGPRRYGKTSVLRRVAHDVGDATLPVVWLDLFELGSMTDLAIRLDGALHDVGGRLGRAMARTAASIGINLGVLRFELAKPARPDTTASVHALLDIMVDAVADEGGLLIIDEFAGIARVDGAAGLLRTKLQHRYRALGLLFAGSEPTTMRALFSLQEQPFYGQADLVDIGPLDPAAVDDIVVEGFATTGRDPGALPSLIHAFTGGHPQRTMQLADAAWQRSRPGDTWTAAVWEHARADVQAATAAPCETLVASLESPEQAVLRILASGGSIWGRAAEMLGLNPSPAKRALERLRAAGHVVTAGGTHRIVDPVFADWLRLALPI